MKKIKLLVWLISGILLFNACENAIKNDDYINIDGYVITQDGTPVEGAIVKAFNSEKVFAIDTTDSDGLFYLPAIPKSAMGLQLEAHKEGFSINNMPFKSAEGMMMKGKLPIVLGKGEDCCNTVNVLVKDDETGEAIKDAQVKIAQKNDFYKIKNTDDNGKVSFDSLCKGSYWIRVYKDGYQVKEEDFKLDSCKTLNFEIKLKKQNKENCCNQFELKITDKESGSPINEAEVKLYNKNGYSNKLYTNQDGYVKFTSLCSDYYIYRVYKANYEVIEGDVKLGECDTVIKSLQLRKVNSDTCCNNKLSVYLYDGDNKEFVKGAKVTIWKNGSVYKSKLSETNPVKFEEICSGVYGVSITHDNYKTVEFKAEFGCNGDKVVEQILYKKQNTDTCCNNTLKVIIKDKDTGELIKNGKVKLIKDNQVIETKTTENGYVVFEKICSGKYQVNVYSDKYQVSETIVSFICNENKELVALLKKNQNEVCCDNVLKVTVVNKENQPIKNAKVKLWLNNSEFLYAYSNENGLAIIEKICKGIYGISINHEEYNSQEYKVEFNCGETKELKAELTKNTKDSCCDGKVKIWVKNENGELIKTAKINLWSGGKIISTLKSEQGYVLFEKLCQGKYGVSILAEQYKGQEFDFTLGCNESKEFTKTLQKNSNDSCNTAVLKLIIKDNDTKNPISGASVKIYSNNQLVAEGKSTEDGYFVKEQLKAPAVYLIVVTKDDFNGAEFKIEFKECTKYQETVWLKKK